MLPFATNWGHLTMMSCDGELDIGESIDTYMYT
jgi:hypothetical protein